MSICLKLFIFVVLLVVTGHSLPTLSEKQCKDYLASNDINQQIQALFLCPEKWRQKVNRITGPVIKRSVLEEEYTDELPDDFYVFWIMRHPIIYIDISMNRPIEGAAMLEINMEEVEQRYESLAMKILILSILICYLLLMYSNDVVTRPLDSSKCDKYNKKDVVLKLFLIYRDLGVKQGLICAEAEFTKAGR
ncbi:unnamed protein product [Adineta ricciae]|uniref:Uncharacterized protein n=1 Tax=Adineta ricciae TaxID=249248 RepID=A0A813NEW8_ADIRI|nr:unnamed protein product [Adineta ricciae]